MGIDRVNAAFKRAGRQIEKGKPAYLKLAAEPVRRDAEILAASSIANITHPWSRMRVGVTKRAVYVAPRKRGTRFLTRRRPNLARLLRFNAMEPALDRNRIQVANQLDKLLDRIEQDF
jgi:hypothetical protein